MWQVGDFDSDGQSDSTKNGCRVWVPQTWLPDRERFPFSAKIVYQADANGKPVKNCR